MTATFLRAGDAERGFSGKVNHLFDRLRDWYGRELDATLRMRARGLYRLDRPDDDRRDHVLPPSEARCQGTRARRKTRASSSASSTRSANATIEQTAIFADAAGKVFKSFPQTRFHLPAHFPEQRLRRDGPETVGSAQGNGLRAAPAGAGRNSAPFRGSRCFRSCPLRCPVAAQFPVEFVLLRPRSRNACSSLRNKFKPKRWPAAHSFSRPSSTPRSISRRPKLVIDHDKVAALGLNLPACRRRHLRHVRRQFRQPLQYCRPQLQSDSASQTDRSLEPRPAQGHLRHRSGQQTDPAQHHRHDQGRRPFRVP